METFNAISSTILIALLLAGSTLAQSNSRLVENAALRYWAAFSATQDAGVTDQQAKELNAILDGMAPYDDLKYKDLLEKNSLALKIMVRGTTLPNCEWGLDYGLGEDLPGDYVKKALVLGRLNVLNSFHLLKTGNKDGAVGALAAGLRFSHDVGNGGSLFANLVAKDLLTSHLRAVSDALHLEQLSSSQRSQLQTAVTRVGEGVDWVAAAKRDLEALRGDYARNPRASMALNRIISSYIAALNDGSKLPVLDHAVEDAPRELADLIPNARRMLEQKQDLSNTLLQTRALLQ
jgi:hypothetical protein